MLHFPARGLRALLSEHHAGASARCQDAHRRSTVRDPIPDAMAELLWLGGEAMVAPSCLADARAADAEEADLEWRVI